MSPVGFEVAIIAIVVGGVTNLFGKILVNQDRLEEIKKRTKEIQKRSAEARKSKDPNAMKKVEGENKEMMGLMKEQMTMSMKPMMFTIVPILVMFYFIRQWYGEAGVVVSGLPIFNELGWFGWYILVAFATMIPIEIIWRTYRKKKKAKKLLGKVSSKGE